MKAALLWELLRLNRQQYIRERQLEQITFQKLRRQVLRAWHYSPYFYEAFSTAGFHPNQLTSLADLTRLPILRKSELLTAGKSAYCTDVDLSSCTWLKTSGLSRTPSKIPFTQFDKAHRILRELRALRAHGFSYRDTMAVVWIPRHLVEENPLKKLGLLRREYLSANDDSAAQLARLTGLNAQIIYSYGSNLRILAKEIESNPMAKRPQPRILISSADQLDLRTRKLLTHAFGVEPVDFYGAIEFGWIAWQCRERHGYHINSDCLIVECVKDGMPVMRGEEGELVITNLHSDAAPLIRYATGDMGVLDSARCACGRTLPILSRITGRSEDSIILPGGRLMLPHAVASTIEEIPGVRQLQVVQEADGTLRVRLVPGNPFPEAVTVRNVLQKKLSISLNVIVEYLNALPKEANGTFRAVQCCLDTTSAARSALDSAL